MKSRFFQRQKKQRGFLSIEAIVVLVVVLGLLALGASKMDMLTGNSNATEELSNVQALYVATKGLKSSAGYGTSGTDLMATLIAGGGVPKNITVAGGVATNLFGGTITVASTGAGFTLTENNLSQDVCIKLAMKVSAGGQFTNTSLNGGSAITGPMSSAQAGAGCTNSGNANTVTWTSLT